MNNKNAIRRAIDIQDGFRKQFSSLGKEPPLPAPFVFWRLPRMGASGHLRSFVEVLVLASPVSQKSQVLEVRWQVR